MKNVALLKHRQRIQLLIDRTSNATNGDIEMQSEWAKYLCVLIAGYVENIVRELYSDFVIARASPPVRRFSTAHIEAVQNPKAEKLVRIADSFSNSWKLTLESYLVEQGRGDAIDAIMTNRHQIAHGRHSGISLVRVKDYLKKIDEVAEFVSVELEKGIQI